MKNILSQIFKKERNTVQLQNIHNLNTLKWVDFLEIVKYNKIVLLDKNYSDNKKYTKKDDELLKEQWIKLQDEAYEIENNEEAKMLLKKSFERLILVETIKLLEGDVKLLIWLSKSIELYEACDNLPKYFEELQGIYDMVQKHNKKIKLNPMDSIEKNISIIEKALLSLINEYNTKFKDIEHKVNKITNSIFYNVLVINRITGLQLNAMTMVCAEWFEAKKIAKELSTEQSNKGNNE